MNCTSGTTGAPTLRKRLLAIAIALALVVCVTPSLAPLAYADDTVTVTLTVLAGTQTDYDTNTTTYSTWVNKNYQVKAGATLENLLDAAVAAGDLKAYTAPESSYGGKYVGSITSSADVDLANTSSDDFSTSLYWSYYQDGDYGQGDCAIDHVVLSDKGTYQFAWDCYTSAKAPEWNAYYAQNPIAGGTATSPAVGADQVGLTITAGSATDYTTNTTTDVTWINKAYAIDDIVSKANKQAADLTVEDLLDYAVSQGDIKAFTAPASTYGGNYVGSITSTAGLDLANWSSPDFSTSLYWAYYQDASYGQGDCAVDHVKLAGSSSYQFAWDCFTSATAPADKTAWETYYRENPPVGITDKPVEPEPTPTPPADEDTQNEATGVDEAAIADLMSNIAASYKNTSDPWQAMDLAALNRRGDVDRIKLLADGLALIKDPGMDSTAIQRSIIALTANGYDARSLPDGKDTCDAIAILGQRMNAATVLNARIAALWAYASGDYELASDARMTIDQLIESLVGDQLADGGFALSGSAPSSDLTAMAIAALAPYAAANTEAKGAMDRALAALENMQLADGGFADIDGTPNACSTAFAIIAMCSAGLNPAEQWATASGATPLSALLAYALPDRSGFAFEKDGEKDPLATEQGFRALAAYEGLLNAKAKDGTATYDIYAQARLGTSSIPGSSTSSVEQTTPGPARTGFAEPPISTPLVIIALCALSYLVASRLRTRVSSK